MTKSKTTFQHAALAGSALLLAACTVMPTGPSVMVLPGTGATMERFQADDAYCRQFANYQIGGKTAGDASRESVVTSAIVGTAVGALAGAAIGGNSRGAGTGAGAGLLLGTAMGSDSARSSGYGTQRQYDNAYIQCMYTKGHRVPVPAGMTQTQPHYPARTMESAVPPPPPGSPPPPPPGR